MLCAISGEAPQIAVVSKTNGNVYERRLIEAYIAENGKDPVTGEELTAEDLIDLKTSRFVRPRPPTLTSIPSLLSVFQNEWDALALESYTLRQQLTQTRQELSTALYQHDAAVRVIARLTRERDEARDALSKFTIKAEQPRNGDHMEVDSDSLPDNVVARIDATHTKLSKTRRKRAIPEDWATVENIQSFSVTQKSEALYPSSRTFAMQEDGDLVLIGGTNGVSGIYSIKQESVVLSLKVGGGLITDTIWSGGRAICADASGSVKVFDGGEEIAKFESHAGSVTAISLHPTGDILASVGVDKSFVLYDLEAMKTISQVYTDSELISASFHPDGHLFAAGGKDGQVKLFDIKTGTNPVNFETSAPLTTLSFSENGTWLASASEGQTNVTIWDLRKTTQIKVLEVGSPITTVKWDYTGQFLAISGPSGVSIQYYSKSSKDWSEPLRSATPSVDIVWGPDAQSLLCLNVDGSIAILGES